MRLDVTSLGHCGFGFDHIELFPASPTETK
jgi:hypothetical protein